MFWNTSEPHGLPRDPFKSCIIPRPIGWISTVAPDGTLNLAPYSFFNGVASDPPMVMFSSGGLSADDNGNQKDSISNAKASGDFVCSMVSHDLLDAMNESSATLPSNVDEFALAGLETEPSELVKAPRVKAAPIHMECTFYDSIDLPEDRNGARNAICIGRVVGVHIRDEVMKDGFVDVTAFRPVARMGYMDYTVVDNIFTLLRPGMKG
jgi:flavin reductase (DIM6/NTAB) family NADH-FMN oxidoreductase RutF